MLENTIRSGMLGQLTHVLAAVNSKSPTAAKQQLLTSQAKDYNGSDSRCDIPLRAPLDPEARLTRKLAWQVYNKEKIEKVKENKEFVVTEKE
jgi:hypothetical protein